MISTMRRMINLIEAARRPDTKFTTDQIEHAAWWLTRFVSGSMNDPDWDDSWTSIDAVEALRIVGQVVGNKRASAKPILWRHLSVSKKEARRLEQSKLLLPHAFPYQSFTGKKVVAFEDGPDIVGEPQPGNISVVVSAKPPADLIAFGMADLRLSRNLTIREAVSSLADWFHQDEVLVVVRGPLPILGVEVLS